MDKTSKRSAAYMSSIPSLSWTSQSLVATFLTPPNISSSHAFSHVAHTPSSVLRLQLVSNASSHTLQITSGRAPVLTTGSASALTSGDISLLFSLIMPTNGDPALFKNSENGVKNRASRSSQGYHCIDQWPFKLLPLTQQRLQTQIVWDLGGISLNRFKANPPVLILMCWLVYIRKMLNLQDFFGRDYRIDRR